MRSIPVGFAPRSGMSHLRETLGNVYHDAKNFGDRILHPRRHWAALQRLSRLGRPHRILVVCHGNICRSPYLEAALQRALPDIAVSSAGFIGPRRVVPPFSLEASARRGFDLSRFRSQLVTPEKVRNSDVIFVMDARQARHIQQRFRVDRRKLFIAGDFDSLRGPTRGIADPWMQPIEAFESAFDRLDRCARAISLAIG